MRRLIEIAPAAWFALAAAAQVPGLPPAAQPPAATAAAAAAAPAQEPGAAPRTPFTTHVHDEALSRDLFRCCDRDGDDRLDLFEARAAVDALAGAHGLSTFRRLDADRDGYLDWPEFDRYYLDVVRSGSTLRLDLCRTPHAAPAPDPSSQAAAAARPPQRQLLDLFDVDHDGGLSAAERDALLRELGLPPMFAAMLGSLDRNRNGRLDEQELAPMLTQLNLTGLFARKTSASKPSALGAPWAAVDADGDGSITAAELEAALRRIDPELARWVGAILAHADRNGDGRLGPRELPTAADPAAKAMAGVRAIR